MFGDTKGLVERCIRREEKAWEEFIERFSGLLYYSAQERLRRSGIRFGKQDIEDIVQEIFLELWKGDKLESIRQRDNIKSWLSVVAQTRALNYMRHKKERLLDENEFYVLDSLEAEQTTRFPGDTLIDLVEKTIETFRPREKLILKLNIIYGKKQREIAEFMRLPLNTVSTIIARNKKVLEQRLKDLKENG